MRRLTGLALVVGLGACAPKDVPIAEQSNSARQAIEAANAEFVQHFNQGHGDLVAATYTEDGVLMVVNNPVASGRAAIAAMVSGIAAMKPALTLKVDNVVAHGPLAVERGAYSLTVTPPGAPGPVTENGTYLVHWQKVGDKWLKVSDVATSDKPLPAGPPAPASPAATK